MPQKFRFFCHPHRVLQRMDRLSLAALGTWNHWNIWSPLVETEPSPACFSKFLEVHPTICFLMHWFKPRLQWPSLDKLEGQNSLAMRSRQSQKNLLWALDSRLNTLGPKPLATKNPSYAEWLFWPSGNFLANLRICLWSNWKSCRSSSLSSFSSAFCHSLILGHQEPMVCLGQQHKNLQKAGKNLVKVRPRCKDCRNWQD